MIVFKNKREDSIIFENSPLTEKLVSGFCQPLESYTGVTKVLDVTSDKSFLDKWRNRVGIDEANRITQESIDIGKSFDELMFKHLQGIDVSNLIDEPGYHLYKQSLKYLKHIDPIALQLHIHSNKLKMHGYIDCLCYYKGVLSILDFKNSKKEKPQEFLDNYYKQCTFYAMMMYDMYKIEVKQIVLFIGIRHGMYPQIETHKTKYFVNECLEAYRIYKGIIK